MPSLNISRIEKSIIKEINATDESYLGARIEETTGEDFKQILHMIKDF